MIGRRLVFFVLALCALQVHGQVPQRGVPKRTTRNPHGALNIPCENCHTSLSWKPIRSIPEFDHDSTKYPLRGMHEKVTCTQCHVKPVFTNVGQKCADCHADLHRGQFGANCESCHSVKGWRVSVQAIRDHQNRFPLIGAHASVDCESCHKGAATGQFVGLSTQCYSCHATDFKNTKNPNHVVTGFSTSCQQCHGTNTWLDANFDHASTGFPLTNAHADPPRVCMDCHINNNFNLTTSACVSCHLKDFQGTTSPNHVKGGFSQTCQTCHSTIAWQPATFDHSSVGFPLTNAHADPPRVCLDCHVNNNFNLTTTACVSCHLKNFQGATNPNHVSGGFSQTCQACHTTIAWQPATFDHNSVGFPLTNSHADPPRVCLDCHISNNYNLATSACVSCHLKDFQGAANPNHVSGGFSQTCQTCHTTIAWQSASFDHNSVGFPLTNSHADPPRVCLDCHINNNYALTTTACVSCHLKDFQGATNPNHVAGGFSQTCQTCHTTIAWQAATFDHTKVGFALTNAHADPPRVCLDCHINNNYNLTTTACASCHLKDYNTATTPINHTQLGFPTACESCHDTIRWTDGKFDHSTTGFALTNAHMVPPRVCADCHINNNYNLTSTACSSCHLKDYNGATTPINHIQLGFPTTCELCHDTVQWTDGKFDHSKTAFPLTGFHTQVPCANCHINNNYTTLPTTCVGCHQADYNATTNPIHSAAPTIFTTNCTTCHNTTSWSGATFSHMWWSINHGNANGVCATCHTNPNNYVVFSCTNGSCHPKARTDSTHQGIGGYVYNSVNCYSCHKNGGGG